MNSFRFFVKVSLTMLLTILLVNSSSLAADYKLKRKIPDSFRPAVTLSEAGKLWYYDDGLKVQELDGTEIASYKSYNYIETPNEPPPAEGFPFVENSNGDMLLVSPTTIIANLRSGSTNPLFPIQLQLKPNGQGIIPISTVQWEKENESTVHYVISMFTNLDTFLSPDRSIVIQKKQKFFDLESPWVVSFFDPSGGKLGQIVLQEVFADLLKKFPTTLYQDSMSLGVNQSMNSGVALVSFGHVIAYPGIVPDSGFYRVNYQGQVESLGNGPLDYIGKALDGGAYFYRWQAGSQQDGKAVKCQATGPCVTLRRNSSSRGVIVYANDFGDQIFKKSSTDALYVENKAGLAVPLECRLQPDRVRPRKATFNINQGNFLSWSFTHGNSTNPRGDLVVEENGTPTFGERLVYQRNANSTKNYCASTSLQLSRNCLPYFTRTAQGFKQTRSVARDTTCELTATVSDVTGRAANIAGAGLSFLGSKQVAKTSSRGRAVKKFVVHRRNNKDQTLIIRFPDNSHWTDERTIDLR